MPKMSQSEIAAKLKEGWRWGGEPNTNPASLYRGSMDSVMEALIPETGEIVRRFATAEHRDAWHKKQGLS